MGERRHADNSVGAPEGERSLRRRAGASAALLAVLAAGAAACGADPFAVHWTAAPDTVVLYSLAQPDLNLASAFSFKNRVVVKIEEPTASGTWDLALDTEEGQLVLLPPRALGVQSSARITAIPGLDFDEVTQAPADTTVWVRDRGLPAEVGTVYVVQTGQSSGNFGQGCVYYAKMMPLALDPVAGTLRFLYDTNPVCNDSRLVPPD